MARHVLDRCRAERRRPSSTFLRAMEFRQEHQVSPTMYGSVIYLISTRYKHDRRMEWLALPIRKLSLVCARPALTSLAWTNVHSAQEEVKRIHDNEFRAEHPHLSEWKEVSHVNGFTRSSATDRDTAWPAVCPSVPFPPVRCAPSLRACAAGFGTGTDTAVCRRLEPWYPAGGQHTA